jgi:hypothetical protein
VSNQESVTSLYSRERPLYQYAGESSSVVGVLATREEDPSLKPFSFDISFLLSDSCSNLAPGETATPFTTTYYDDLTDIISDNITCPVPDVAIVTGTYLTHSPTSTGSLSEPVDPSVSLSFTGSPCTSPTGSSSESLQSLSSASPQSTGSSSEYLESQSFVSPKSSDVPRPSKKQRRINYSLEQLKILENVFEGTPYPETERIEKLGQDFNISDGKIRVSF